MPNIECLIQRCCAVLSHSVVSYSATPWTEACQAPLSMGIFQARILEWVAYPYPGDLPDPGIKPELLLIHKSINNCDQLSLPLHLWFSNLVSIRTIQVIWLKCRFSGSTPEILFPLVWDEVQESTCATQFQGNLCCWQSINHTLRNTALWSQAIKRERKKKVFPIAAAASATAKPLQSCLTLCDPPDGSPSGSPFLRFSRQEHWSGLPFPSSMHESEK